MNEQETQKLIQLEASRRGLRMWRNNLGAYFDERGNFIRYGLANDSAAVNKQFKSGDLIGITPMLITQEMVGLTVGVFTSLEVKRPGWKFSGKGREAAQKTWIDLVQSLGGIARFISNAEDL